GHLLPREPAPQRLGEGHRRVQMRAGDAAGDVDAEHHREAPGEGDQDPVATVEGEFAAPGLTEPGDAGGDDAAAEGDQDKGAEELGPGPPPGRLLPAPPSRCSSAAVTR